MVDEVPEDDITALTCRNKAHVILVPINGSYFVHVTLALIVRRWGFTVVSVKVVHKGRTLCIRSSEEVTTMTELDFSASFQGDTLELLKLL